MCIAYQHVKKICRDLLAKLAKGVIMFSDFIANGINIFQCCVTTCLGTHFFAVQFLPDPWGSGVYTVNEEIKSMQG